MIPLPISPQLLLGTILLTFSQPKVSYTTVRGFPSDIIFLNGCYAILETKCYLIDCFIENFYCLLFLELFVPGFIVALGKI